MNTEKKEKREIYCLLFIVVPYPVRYYLCRTNGYVTVTVVVAAEREEGDVFVILLFALFPLDIHNSSHLAYNTDS